MRQAIADLNILAYNTQMVSPRFLLPVALGVALILHAAPLALAQDDTASDLDIPSPEDVLDAEELIQEQLRQAAAGYIPYNARLANEAARRRERAIAEGTRGEEDIATSPEEETVITQEEESIDEESLTAEERRLLERSRNRGIAVEPVPLGQEEGAMHAAASEEELPLIPTGPASVAAGLLLAGAAGWTVWRARMHD